jgi:alanyl-tRNA synthetase
MTIKEYYNDQFLMKCKSVCKRITETGAVFDKTVAFPEGGGQEGDFGTITDIKTGDVINFTYTTQYGGTIVNLEGFHAIHIGTDIIHHIDANDLEKIHVGQEYEISINIERRALLTLNHSGIHIVLMALESLCPNIQEKIFGAKISDKSARLDFRPIGKFEPNDIQKITNITNEIIKNNKEILIIPHELEKEAFYWKCENYIIPCGGTHLPATGFLGNATIKRKNLGKGAERIIVNFENYSLPCDLYHA